jgi:hypothetical protein
MERRRREYLMSTLDEELPPKANGEKIRKPKINLSEEMESRNRDLQHLNLALEYLKRK